MTPIKTYTKPKGSDEPGHIRYPLEGGYYVLCDTHLVGEKLVNLERVITNLCERCEELEEIKDPRLKKTLRLATQRSNQ